MVEAEKLWRRGRCVVHFDGERGERGVRVGSGVVYERRIGEAIDFDSHESERGPAGQGPGAMKGRVRGI